MKQIAIHAYPFGNVGDDLFIRLLTSRYPDVHFHLAMDPSYAGAFNRVPNMTIHPNRSLTARIRSCMRKTSTFPAATEEKIEATVYIGGSLFIEQPGWEQAFSHMKRMHTQGRPFFIIGANFGPYVTDHFKHIHEDFFLSITDICFRDDDSYTLFQQIDHVRYAPDAIFQLAGAIEKAPDVQEEHLLISVIDPSIRSDLADIDDAYFAALARIVTEAVEKNWAVTLTAFCPYEQDDVAAWEVIRRIPATYKNYVDLHTYDGNLEEVFQLFQRATHVVATRFHAMILGWIYEKKVLPITYSPKMETVLADMNYTGDVQPIKQMSATTRPDVFTMTQAHVPLEQLARTSTDHFKQLDVLLAGN